MLYRRNSMMLFDGLTNLSRPRRNIPMESEAAVHGACLGTPDKDATDRWKWSWVSISNCHRAQTGFSHQYDTLSLPPYFACYSAAWWMICVSRSGERATRRAEKGVVVSWLDRSSARNHSAFPHDDHEQWALLGRHPSSSVPCLSILTDGRAVILPSHGTPLWLSQ